MNGEHSGQPEALSTDSVSQQLRNWFDPPSTDGQRVAMRAADLLDELEQFKVWAEPQCQDWAANRQEIDRLRAALRAVEPFMGAASREEIQKALRPAAETCALSACSFAMSEPDGRGFRLVLGFETSDQSVAALQCVTKLRRQAAQKGSVHEVNHE